MADRPHIIYLLSDEHFGGAMGHAGDVNVRTPHMDRLGAEGLSMGRAYANCPICTPSRGTIFSGRHAHAGPVQYFFDVYKPAAPSIATILREEGYHTAYFGKWHCGVVRDQEPPAVRADRDSFTRWPQRTPDSDGWLDFELEQVGHEGNAHVARARAFVLPGDFHLLVFRCHIAAFIAEHNNG